MLKHRIHIAKRFNPSVGIAFIQTEDDHVQCYQVQCFNPSVGIAFIQTEELGAGTDHKEGFNPSVGIAFIQTALEMMLQSGVRVSIPQSG